MRPSDHAPFNLREPSGAGCPPWRAGAGWFRLRTIRSAGYADSEGRRIEKLPEAGWDVADAYGLLIDLDTAGAFAEAIAKGERVRIAYVVTDDERRFQSIVRQLPSSVDPVRLYESYLTNFRFSMGR